MPYIFLYHITNFFKFMKASHFYHSIDFHTWISFLRLSVPEQYHIVFCPLGILSSTIETQSYALSTSIEGTHQEQLF
jgi:hypothetical protein